MKRNLLFALLLMIAGLQTANAQGFRVYKSDGTIAQFSLRTDSIVFYEGIGTDVDFGPFTPVNQMIVGTWYKIKQELTFNEDGTTDYIDGATYKFFPYQGTIIIYNASDAPVNIFKVHEVTADRMIVNTLGGKENFFTLNRTPQPQPVTEIVLSDESLNLQPGNTYQLSAIVLPENADNCVVTWESSNEDIAEVTKKGMVMAYTEGSCAITCRATDGSGVYAECQVTVGVPDTHEYVDLGLPSGTLWATCNIGADNPEEHGDYFAWGETEPKEDYSWDTYKYWDATYEMVTKYCMDSTSGIIDDKFELEPEDDAATVNWGSNWQMPSYEQFKELIDSVNNTIIKKMELNGIKGRMIISRTNGNRIFLPAVGGTRYEDKLLWEETECDYWSRTISNYSNKKEYWSRAAVSLDVKYKYSLSLAAWGGTSLYRHTGKSVRPVRKQ